MRQIQILVIMSLVWGSCFMANAHNPVGRFDPDPIKMSLKISKMLLHHELDLKKDIRANVLIAINKKHEIVVLSVDTTNKEVERFIKQRLNYKKLDCEVDLEIKEFKLPVLLKTKA